MFNDGGYLWFHRPSIFLSFFGFILSIFSRKAQSSNIFSNNIALQALITKHALLSHKTCEHNQNRWSLRGNKVHFSELLYGYWAFTKENLNRSTGRVSFHSSDWFLAQQAQDRSHQKVISKLSVRINYD